MSGQIPDLGMTRYGLRFSSPSTEADYRQWRNEKNLPLYRLTGAVSIPPWAVQPFVGYQWNDQIAWFQVWQLGFVLVIPVLILLILITFTTWRRFATPVCALTLMVAGSTMLWICIRSIEPVVEGSALGPTAAVLILMTCFALFMRLPPLMAVVSVMPFVTTLVWLVVMRGESGVILRLEVYGYLSALGSSYFFVILISVVTERFLRRTFINERMLGEHQVHLEHSQRLIRRYVPPAVADRIIDGGEEDIASPRRCRVTVLFCDVVGFTSIADRVEPEDVARVLNEYMGAMSEIVDSHRGTLNEFAGDGLMSLFGAPNEMDAETQATSAVRAALEMQQRMPALNETWRKLGVTEPLRIRIGINTGLNSVGSYGSEGRMTYTAIGQQTNIAARIESKAEPGTILISDATYQLARDAFLCDPKGEIEVKGVHFPIKAYEVVSPAEPADGTDRAGSL